MIKLQTLLAFSVSLLAGLFAAGSAQSGDGGSASSWDEQWYVEGLVGAALPLERDVTVDGAAGTYEPDGGFTVAGAVGRHMGPNWRAELGVSWTQANDGTVVLGGVPIPHTGDINVITVLLNALYEFDTSSSWRPFLGAGVGFAVFDLDTFGGGAFSFSDSDTTLAGALHAGVEVPVAPNVSLVGRYALMASGEASFATPLGGGHTATKKAGIDHVFLFGLHADLN